MPSSAAIPEAEVIPAEFWNSDPKYFITATNQTMQSIQASAIGLSYLG